MAIKVIKPNPPTCIRHIMINCPSILNCVAVVKVTNPVTQVALVAVNKLSRYGAGFRSLHMGKDNKMLPNKIIIQKLKTNI